MLKSRRKCGSHRWRAALAATRVTVCVALLVVVSVRDASAQVSALGKGFLFYAPGGLTSNPNEVISGRSSIKVSNSGTDLFMPFLRTDSNFIHFAHGQTYTITVSYRVIAQGSRGCNMSFSSETGVREGRGFRTVSFGGATGTSGTATLTERLDSYDDFIVDFRIEGTGTFAVDDIRITDSAGQLVVSENAEGPTIVPGPLNLQLTDAIFLPFGTLAAFLKSAVATDLDGDGYPEGLLTLTDSHNGSRTPVPILVIQADGKMRVATTDFFPGGIPTVNHSPSTAIVDLNGDGLNDMVFAEAGGDPVGEGRMSIAMNLGGGKYRDVSDLTPADLQNTRSYAFVAGDVLSDGHVDILLPDAETGRNTALLRWSGDHFDAIRNWIPQSLWASEPNGLHHHTWLNLADLDNDGRQDLIVGGQPQTPNIRLAFGASGGFSAAGVVTLPDGPWGHIPGGRPIGIPGGIPDPVVVADFNNDGLADIFAAERKAVWDGQNSVFSDVSIQVFINQGSRRFIDVTAPNYDNLGDRYYFSLQPVDVNNDGFLDVIGLSQTIRPSTLRMMYGTTFFLNDGAGHFQVVDGSQVLGVTTTPSNGDRWSLGSFVPTVITPQRIEGIVAETVGLTCGNCTGLNLYKIVGNGSIGTGPNFADSARLGVAGFNEFFYLNQHPEVAAAIERGEYRSGLDHYLVEGYAKGYAMHAPNARGR